MRYRGITLFTLICVGALFLTGCDFVYKILQREGAEEKKILGEIIPFNHNPKVEELQGFLKLYGYSPGKVDGKFGPKTRKAVKAFQEAQGLKVSRFVDKKTWARLSIFKTTGLVNDGEIDFKTVQIALQNAQFDPGKIDGVFGSQTIRALKSFQEAHGLKPDGVIGLKTLSMLKEYLPQ